MTLAVSGSWWLCKDKENLRFKGFATLASVGVEGIGATGSGVGEVRARNATGVALDSLCWGWIADNCRKRYDDYDGAGRSHD